MENTVDLHMHSTASDGILRVEELMKLAARLGLKTIALTDHDTTDGLDNAIEIGRTLGIEVIPGIELTAQDGKDEVHVLGYFINYHDTALQTRLKDFREKRYNRGEVTARKLAELGMPVEWERIVEIANGAPVGRPHIAEALREKGYVATVSEAFHKYLYDGGPAYIERPKISPVEAVEIIRSAGGLATMAHPTYVKQAERILGDMAAAGLTGVECHYGLYDDATVDGLRELANRYKLVATGGSDYHGRPDDDVHAYLGARYVPNQAVIELKAKHQKG